MSEQRRALCAELAEVDAEIAELQQWLLTYKANTSPTWDEVHRLRLVKTLLDELLGQVRVV